MNDITLHYITQNPTINAVRSFNKNYCNTVFLLLKLIAFIQKVDRLLKAAHDFLSPLLTTFNDHKYLLLTNNCT